MMRFARFRHLPPALSVAGISLLVLIHITLSYSLFKPRVMLPTLLDTAILDVDLCTRGFLLRENGSLRERGRCEKRGTKRPTKLHRGCARARDGSNTHTHIRIYVQRGSRAEDYLENG